ncbi:MAG: DedA family protein [Candidatus Xenobia bacterium]
MPWVMDTLKNGGYLGIVLLMALESSIVPIPAELVIPPAAYWASQGQLSLVGVVLAGAFGGWVGSSINYWLSYAVGRPVVLRYGRIFLLPPEKLELVEGWVTQYGVPGIFFSRLLPVVRHLISIPAGICRMAFLPFSLATVAGAGIWCSVLAWFGPRVITSQMINAQNTTELIDAMKKPTHYILLLIMLLIVLYAVMQRFLHKGETSG